MKKPVFLIGLIVVISIGTLLGKQLLQYNFQVSKTKTSDLKILIVQEFWKVALERGDVDRFITPTPKEFYNSNPRCSSDKVAKTKQDIELTLQTKEDGFTKGLRKTAQGISEGQFSLLDAKIFRFWENEAIVEAEFTRTNNENFKEKKFFFLILVDGKWKIFLDTSVPNMLNPEFAKFDCSQ